MSSRSVRYASSLGIVHYRVIVPQVVSLDDAQPLAGYRYDGKEVQVRGHVTKVNVQSPANAAWLVYPCNSGL